MYESDGSIMVYWHALDTPETPTGKLTYKLWICYTCRDSKTVSIVKLNKNLEMTTYIIQYSMTQLYFVVPGNVSEQLIHRHNTT